MAHVLELASEAGDRVAVWICYASGLKDLQVIRELCFGIEEEGIPFFVLEQSEGSASTLAVQASSHSQLEVGIGVNEKGGLCLHQAKLPDNFYLFEVNAFDRQVQLRHYGANSARLVKGMPFKDICK